MRNMGWAGRITAMLRLAECRSAVVRLDELSALWHALLQLCPAVYAPSCTRQPRGRAPPKAGVVSRNVDDGGNHGRCSAAREANI